MVKSLLKIFRKIYVSPEVKIYEKIITHSKACREAVKNLRDAMDNYGEKESYLRLLGKVFEHEKKADALRREILELLSKGGLPPISRQDFIRLVERMDMVADYAKEAARVLTILSEKELPQVIIEHLTKLTEIAHDASQMLYDAVKSLGESYDNAFRKVIKVEEIEDEGDTAYINALKSLSDIETKHSVLLEKVIEDIEMSIDACEDTSDVLEEIMIRAIR